MVGESGSGKSATMMSLLKLLPMLPAEIVSGRVRLDGEDLMELDPQDLRRVRGAQVGFVFQDPMTSLNPVLTVGYQLTEPLRAHLGMSRRTIPKSIPSTEIRSIEAIPRLVWPHFRPKAGSRGRFFRLRNSPGMSREEARRRAMDLLERVGIPAAASRLGDFPHQFSGGMRQRMMIAIALACSSKVLIADEPTTALDVTIQAQILDLVKRLRRESGMAIIRITHDLGVMAGLADRIMVMYGGGWWSNARAPGCSTNAPSIPIPAACSASAPCRATRRYAGRTPGEHPRTAPTGSA